MLWSGLGCYTVKCSEILAHIELLYNPRVNNVFTIHYSLFTIHAENLRIVNVDEGVDAIIDARRS